MDKVEDLNIIRKMFVQCEIMRKSMIKYRLSPELLSDDGLLFNGCCETVFEIGELSHKLSPEFKAKYNEQHWELMYGMRNRIGHNYSDVKLMILWQTLTESLPKLGEFCKKILEQ